MTKIFFFAFIKKVNYFQFGKNLRLQKRYVRQLIFIFSPPFLLLLNPRSGMEKDSCSGINISDPQQWWVITVHQIKKIILVLRFHIRSLLDLVTGQNSYLDGDRPPPPPCKEVKNSHVKSKKFRSCSI